MERLKAFFCYLVAVIVCLLFFFSFFFLLSVTLLPFFISFFFIFGTPSITACQKEHSYQKVTEIISFVTDSSKAERIKIDFPTSPHSTRMVAIAIALSLSFSLSMSFTFIIFFSFILFLSLFCCCIYSSFFRFLLCPQRGRIKKNNQRRIWRIVQ